VSVRLTMACAIWSSLKFLLLARYGGRAINLVFQPFENMDHWPHFAAAERRNTGSPLCPSEV
jgi:hypothetical protein